MRKLRILIAAMIVAPLAPLKTATALDLTEPATSAPAPQAQQQKQAPKPKTLSAAQRKAPLANFTLSHIAEMAALGHPEAQMKLGFAYATGQGVPVDMKKSFDWTIKAARQGNMKAQYNIGLSYANGEGVARNVEKATKWMDKSAHQGFQPAAEYMDVFNKTQQSGGITPALKGIEKAAIEGNKDAAFKTAELYKRDGNTIKYVEWMEKAAYMGHAEAQFTMASLVLEKYSNQDKFKWNLMAAENGHAKAQANMALFYGTADDTPYDIEKSYAWMRTAQKNGHHFAPSDVENMERNVSLFRKEADALADEYIGKYGKR